MNNKETVKAVIAEVGIIEPPNPDSAAPPHDYGNIPPVMTRRREDYRGGDAPEGPKDTVPPGVYFGSKCRCDCVSCVTGDHLHCYYYPQPICCPYIASAEYVSSNNPWAEGIPGYNKEGFVVNNPYEPEPETDEDY